MGTDRMRVRASDAPLRHVGELIRRARVKYKLSSMSNNPSDRTALSVPEPVAYVRDLLRGIAAPWFLCGGWAVDAWVGQQTRDHWDVDIAIFHDDQRAIFEHFAGWALIAVNSVISGRRQRFHEEFTKGCHEPLSLHRQRRLTMVEVKNVFGQRKIIQHGGVVLDVDIDRIDEAGAISGYVNQTTLNHAYR